MKRKWLILLLGFALQLGGCAPIAAGVGIQDASVALSVADTIGASTEAAYEYMVAVEYLNKAREEYGYADYAAAKRFAQQALSFARKAYTKADLGSRLQYSRNDHADE